MRKLMSKEEKDLLIESFYDKEKKRFKSTGSIAINDGRKAALIEYGIIYRAANRSKRGKTFGFDYNLQTYVLEMLNKNIECGNILVANKIERFEFK